MADPEIGELRRDMREAVDSCAEAEWSQSMSSARSDALRDKYRLVMDAVAATGDCPKVNVCWFAKQKVERRMWELYGRPKGLGREEFKIPHTVWYEVGRENGYTDPAFDRRGYQRKEEPELDRPARRKPKDGGDDYSETNRQYIMALHQAGDAFQVVAEWLQRAPVEGNVDPEYAETALAICQAFTKNVHDMANPRRVVPRNMQPLLLDTARTIMGATPMVHEFLIRAIKLRLLRAKSEGGNKWLTNAEINKYLQRQPQDLLMALEPAGPFEAQAYGFHGQRCASCQSWRMVATGVSADRLRCVRCRKEAARRPYIYCRSCLNRNEEGAKKCGNCGAEAGEGGNPNIGPSMGGGS